MNLTCVSGYWNVNNKHGNKYYEWFKNTLKINCPYVFFSNKEGIEIVKKFREGIPTYYIEYELEEFYTFKYKDKFKTDCIHCPSVELNLIWNEKIFLLQKAFQINPFNSSWFKWIDSGTCNYRNKPPPNRPFPNINKLNSLPNNKFIFSSSDSKIFNPDKVTTTNYYHYISGTFILHKNIIDRFVNIYKFYLDKLIDKNNIWTDQVILTHIYKNNPKIFFKLCDGYGAITEFLYLK